VTPALAGAVLIAAGFSAPAATDSVADF